MAREKLPSLRKAPTATVKMACPRPKRLSKRPKDLPQARLLAGTSTRGSTGITVEAMAIARRPSSKSCGRSGAKQSSKAPKKGKREMTCL